MFEHTASTKLHLKSFLKSIVVVSTAHAANAVSSAATTSVQVQVHVTSYINLHVCILLEHAHIV